MRKTEHATTGAEVGFVLLDSTLHPVLLNRSAAEILSYPLKPGTQKGQHSLLAERVRIMLVASPSPGGSPIVSEFRSGNRLYHCHTFRVDAQTNEYSQLSLAVIFDRGSPASLSLRQAAQKYHLTTREQQVLEYLLQGLTSKEIADRMSISTNTVKAFLRLIMIKMGVSTRSGILGKAITSNSDILYPGHPPGVPQGD
jgi:DNA-binding CsgD family transcriptional regulator